MLDVEEFLEHVGIKGMHWGVRKKIQRVSKPTSSDHKRIVELRKKRTPQLTNKQIQDHNTRANLEQNFNRLNPTKVDQGRKMVKTIIANVAGASAAGGAYAFINSPAGKASVHKAQTFMKGRLMKSALKRSMKAARRGGRY